MYNEFVQKVKLSEIITELVKLQHREDCYVYLHTCPAECCPDQLDISTAIAYGLKHYCVRFEDNFDSITVFRLRLDVLEHMRATFNAYHNISEVTRKRLGRLQELIHTLKSMYIESPIDIEVSTSKALGVIERNFRVSIETGAPKELVERSLKALKETQDRMAEKYIDAYM